MWRVPAGEKYEVFLIEEPNAQEPDPRGGPRVAFQVIPSAQARPEPTTGWQSLFAGLLLLLAFGTCVQLGMLANVSKLPKVHNQECLPSLSCSWNCVLRGVYHRSACSMSTVMLVRHLAYVELVLVLRALQETLDWLARPENAAADALPPGLADWDPIPYLTAAFPIAVSTYGIQIVHEAGHRFAAWLRKVRA